MATRGNPLHRWAVGLVTGWAAVVAALGGAEWLASGALTPVKLAVLAALAALPAGLYAFIRWLAGKG